MKSFFFILKDLFQPNFLPALIQAGPSLWVITIPVDSYSPWIIPLAVATYLVLI